MAAPLTTTEVREHVQTDIADTALQRIIDAEHEDMVYHYGELGSQTERFDSGGREKVIYPNRRVASIQSVKEIDKSSGDEVTLSANDYVVIPSGMRIDRLPTGDHASTYWRGTVEVEYTPYDDAKRREGVLIDLVKLALQWGGTDSERLPDYSSTRSREYQTQRMLLMRRLGGRWWA